MKEEDKTKGEGEGGEDGGREEKEARARGSVLSSYVSVDFAVRCAARVASSRARGKELTAA